MTNEYNITITQAELAMIHQALGYAMEQVCDSFVRVFDNFGDCYMEGYTEEEATATADAVTKLMDKIELLSTNDEGCLVLNG